MTFDELLTTYSRIRDPELIQVMKDNAAIENYAMGSFFVAPGERPKGYCILLKGCVRYFYVDADGREHTFCFAEEPSYPVFLCETKENRTIGVQAVTAVSCYRVPFDTLPFELRYHPEFLEAYQDSIQKAIVLMTEVSIHLRDGTAQERYAWFAKRFPISNACVQRRHIASFLSITPETLSRITRGAAAAT